MKNLSVVFFLLLIVPVLTSEAKIVDSSSKFECSWMYECGDAPYPYHEGAILITSQDEDMAVTITLKNGQTISGRNVAIKDGKLTFDIYVEGNLVR